MSVWGKKGVAVVESGEAQASLLDIMSEQLASQINADEQGKMVEGPVENEETSTTEGTGELEGKCDDDFLLARMLQREYDKEHDEELGRRERAYNRNDKVQVSFLKYRVGHPYEDSSASEEDEEETEWRECNTNRRYDVKPPSFGPSGLMKGTNGTMISKHDKEVSGRKNTFRVLQFPPDFPTGDAAGIDLKLSNRVYNELKAHSNSDQKRNSRLHDKNEKATAEQSIDTKTRLILYKLVNNGLLESLGGSIATGKESVVFHAFGGVMPDGSEKPVPKECAVKVFKTTLSEFKNRGEYVKDDYRFKNPRKVLRIWAEKEMRNLNRMRRAGLRCPTVVKLKKHVLVMSFIGADGRPAPQLREVRFDDEQTLRDAFEQCTNMMTTMYVHCRLVHADLSEFNILYWDDAVWFIDVGQAVDTSHPKALLFLARDCRAVCRFFDRRGLVEDLPTERELFNSITGLDIQSDEKFYIEVQEFSLENRDAQKPKDKAHPADCSLRKFREEHALMEEDDQLSSELETAAFQ